jgi:hypothetical protein
VCDRRVEKLSSLDLYGSSEQHCEKEKSAKA